MNSEKVQVHFDKKPSYFEKIRRFFCMMILFFQMNSEKVQVHLDKKNLLEKYTPGGARESRDIYPRSDWFFDLIWIMGHDNDS